VITGPPGIGKSTIISKVILRLQSVGVMVGGCTTVEKRAKGARVGFGIKDLTEGRIGELASVTGKMGPRVGKYRVNLVDLSKIGASGLSRAATSSELIVIDEVGPMELVSPEFRRALDACIESGKPMLAVIHERLDDDLLNKIRAMAEQSLVVTVDNRNELAEELTAEILAAVGGPKAS
jgi:nucleoside-triphosphatase